MDLRLSESSAKAGVTKNQATSAWLRAAEQTQTDSVRRKELIEATALLVATRQFSVEWLK